MTSAKSCDFFYALPPVSGLCRTHAIYQYSTTAFCFWWTPTPRGDIISVSSLSAILYEPYILRGKRHRMAGPPMSHHGHTAGERCACASLRPLVANRFSLGGSSLPRPPSLRSPDKKQSGTERKRESASGRACAARVATLGRRAGGREQSRADRSEACFIFARGREVLWPPREGT